MNKASDLTLVQKTIIETLHKERKKSRRILHQELTVPKALSPNSCMGRLFGGRNVA